CCLLVHLRLQKPTIYFNLPKSIQSKNLNFRKELNLMKTLLPLKNLKKTEKQKTNFFQSLLFCLSGMRTEKFQKELTCFFSKKISNLRTFMNYYLLNNLNQFYL